MQNYWPLLLDGIQTHQMSELEIGLALNQSMAGNHMMTSTAQDHGHCQVLGTQQAIKMVSLIDCARTWKLFIITWAVVFG